MLKLEQVLTIQVSGTKQRLCARYSDAEVVDITLIVAQMNAWNRLAVSFDHKPE